MASIPSNLSRVPNLLSSQLLLAGINRTNVDLFKVQNQLSTGKRISRFSDDSISASAISVLLERLGRSDQTLQNLKSADNTLGVLDNSLTEAQDLILQAKGIASDQVNTTSDSVSRANQAIVIDGLVSSLLQIANRKTNGLYVFGGSTATQPPIQELRGGYRYTGRGSGLLADLDSADDVPITLGGSTLGQTSARHQSTNDLNPALTPETKLADLNGARGLGVRLGTVALSYNGGPSVDVDLSGAESVQDVIDTITLAVRDYETTRGVSILGPGGISVSNGSLLFDISDPGPPPPTLTFTDTSTGTTASDLGLSGAGLSSLNATGTDLDPKLTLLSPLSSLPGVSAPPGGIRLRFTRGGTSQAIDIDLSAARTIDDVRSIIETAAPGVRVQINSRGRGLDIVNEIAGPDLAVEEIPGGSGTAAELGIRTFDATTSLSLFNNGRGVQVVDGRVNPVTSVADRQVNRDFRVTLGNGQVFDVDLRPQDLASVQSVIDRINQEFTDAIGQPPINASAPALAAGQFTASVNDGVNGIAFTQTVGGPAIKVEGLNNSQAAYGLGLLDGAWDTTSATLVAQDRTGVRVNNLFTALLDLRDALRADSTSGITLAGEALEANVDSLASTRALVGVYANRVSRATTRAEDNRVLDESIRSSLQDTDYTEASIRFSTLRTQLQAALQTGSQLQSLSLLDFLR